MPCRAWVIEVAQGDSGVSATPSFKVRTLTQEELSMIEGGHLQMGAVRGSITMEVD